MPSLAAHRGAAGARRSRSPPARMPLLRAAAARSSAGATSASTARADAVRGARAHRPAPPGLVGGLGPRRGRCASARSARRRGRGRRRRRPRAVRDGDVRIDLALDEAPGVETVSPARGGAVHLDAQAGRRRARAAPCARRPRARSTRAASSTTPPAITRGTRPGAGRRASAGGRRARRRWNLVDGRPRRARGHRAHRLGRRRAARGRPRARSRRALDGGRRAALRRRGDARAPREPAARALRLRAAVRHVLAARCRARASCARATG